MKKVIFCFFIAIFTGFSQEIPTQKVSFSLVNPISRVPRWNVAYGYAITPRSFIQLSAGFGRYAIVPKINHFDNRLSIEKKYQFWEVRPEFYYEIYPKLEVFKQFLSLEFFYLKHNDQLTNFWYQSQNEGQLTYLSADYQRIKKGVNLNYSLEVAITRRWFFQWKAGLGVRSRKVSLENIHHAKVKTESILLADYLTDIGEKIGLNLHLDFRVGYRF